MSMILITLRIMYHRYTNNINININMTTSRYIIFQQFFIQHKNTLLYYFKFLNVLK